MVACDFSEIHFFQPVTRFKPVCGDIPIFYVTAWRCVRDLGLSNEVLVTGINHNQAMVELGGIYIPSAKAQIYSNVGYNEGVNFLGVLQILIGHQILL